MKGRKAMKKLFAIIALFCFAATAAWAGEKAPQKVIDLANTTLAPYGTDPVIVKAVKDENAKGKTMAQIKEMDAKWMATPGVADNMKALMTSECGKHLQ